jgi:asparagine synthase (glutamine-hydrolysing)
MMGASGLTPFAPLFDDRIVSLSFEMPGTMKVRGGIEKWVSKRAFEDKLPRSVIERPKSGMRVPVHFWFRGEMKRYARKILSPRNVKQVGIFNSKRVKQILDYDTVEGPGRYGLRLWMLTTFEIWRRIIIDREPP